MEKIYVNNNGSLSPFGSIEEASAELGRSLRLRWGAALRREIASRPQSADPVDERRQAAKGRK